MSANVELVRSIFAAWERGDFSSTRWAHPEIEYAHADGPDPGSWTGITGMADAFRFRVSGLEGYRIEAEQYREVDNERELVLASFKGRAKLSGMEVEQVSGSRRGALVFHVRAEKVTRIIVYVDHDRALADLGLEAQAASQESTTEDLVELSRRFLDANRRDFDGVMSFYAPDAEVDVRAGTFEGAAAIRGLLEDFTIPLEDFHGEFEEFIDLGNGVAFFVPIATGRPVGSSGQLQIRFASVAIWTEGVIVRQTNYDYTDIEQARAAAERLARERASPRTDGHQRGIRSSGQLATINRYAQGWQAVQPTPCHA